VDGREEVKEGGDSGHQIATAELRKRLRNTLQERGWTEVELAWILDCSTPFVRNLMVDPVVTPKLALRLEAALGIEAESWRDMEPDHDLRFLRARLAGELLLVRRRAVRVHELRDEP
jgi:plasmid maintenance system antidote protein VapI